MWEQTSQYLHMPGGYTRATSAPGARTAQGLLKDLQGRDCVNPQCAGQVGRMVGVRKMDFGAESIGLEGKRVLALL